MSTTTTSGRRLSASEAEKLSRAWRERRDARARDRLVLAHAPMVRYLASRKLRELPAHCDVDDLCSSGLVALLEAVDRFDPAKGATFEQYAWTRVAGALVDELRRQDWATRSVRRSGRAIERAQDAWVARHGSQPSRAELAAELRIDVAELQGTLADLEQADVVSLSAPARSVEGSGLVEIGETVEAPGSEHQPELALARGERTAAVRRAMARLSSRERTVLALVHVLEAPGADVGRVLGVSESRVSQILAAARCKLQRELSVYDEQALAA